MEGNYRLQVLLFNHYGTFNYIIFYGCILLKIFMIVKVTCQTKTARVLLLKLQ